MEDNTTPEINKVELELQDIIQIAAIILVNMMIMVPICQGLHLQKMSHMS